MLDSTWTIVIAIDTFISLSCLAHRLLNNYYYLFIKLRAMRVRPDIIVMFMYWFQHSFAFVVLTGVLPDIFCIKSGIKLGNIFSA